MIYIEDGGRLGSAGSASAISWVIVSLRQFTIQSNHSQPLILFLDTAVCVFFTNICSLFFLPAAILGYTLLRWMIKSCIFNLPSFLI